MNIDRHNYEEFFILYLDNELTADERRKVEDFANGNPDLKTELDLLLQSKLSPDDAVIFDDKASLLKFSAEVREPDYAESLLLYTDNELTPAQKESLDQWLSENPAAQQELALLQKTKLQPDLSISFPDKNLLYRKEERRVIAIRWWRMAAAAALLLAVSTTAFMFSRKNQNSHSIAEAGRTPATKQVAEATQTGSAKATESLTPAGDAADNPGQDIGATEQTEALVNTTTPAIETGDRTNNDPVVAVASGKNHIPAEASYKIAEAGQPSSGQQEAIAGQKGNNIYEVVKRTEMAGEFDGAEFASNVDLSADPSLTIQKEFSPLPDVTQEEVQSFELDNPSEKKNRLRGFFRKITRTFEKTTNIKATDGEDRLLVGGLAIKL